VPRNYVLCLYACCKAVGLNCFLDRPGVAQRVGIGIALLFRDRGTRRGWVVSSTPRAHFTPGKKPVPILQEAGWAPGSVWTGGKSRSHRHSIADPPARSQSLYRLSYRAHCLVGTSYILCKLWTWFLNSDVSVCSVCSVWDMPRRRLRLQHGHTAVVAAAIFMDDWSTWAAQKYHGWFTNICKAIRSFHCRCTLCKVVSPEICISELEKFFDLCSGLFPH